MDVDRLAAFDNERMFYRLNYADALQARPYANSRWSAHAAAAVTQRLKSRLAQAGIKVLSATDACDHPGCCASRSTTSRMLRQRRPPAYGDHALRASLFTEPHAGRPAQLRAHAPATSADAAGGARAPGGSTDAVAADIIAWLPRHRQPPG